MEAEKRQEVLHYVQLQQYKKAQELIKLSLRTAPNDGEALYLLATCFNDSGRFSEALDCALDCLRTEGSNFAFSNSAALNSLLGAIYLNLGEYRKSEEHYLESLRQEPNNASCMSKYALLLMMAGHYEKAQALLTEAKRIDPLNQSVKLMENEINFIYSKEKNKAFAPDLQGGDISIDELILLGNNCIDRQQYKAAKEYFRQAFLMQPENEGICSVLNDLEKQTSLWMLPMRALDKIGRIKLQLAFILLLAALRILGHNQLFLVVILIYLSIVVYSYTANRLYDWFVKIKSSFF